jgi:hypothetical protein
MDAFPLRLLSAALVCAALVGCNKSESANISQLREAVHQLGQDLDEERRTIERLRSLTRSRDTLDSEVVKDMKGIMASQEQLKTEISELKQRYETYRQEYRESIRLRAPGMELGDLVVNGTLYKEVVLKELDDAEVSFRHKNGMARTDSMSLPVRWRDTFVIDASLANAALAQRNEKHANDLSVVAMAEQVESPMITAQVRPVVAAAPPPQMEAAPKRIISLMDVLYRKSGPQSRVNGGPRMMGGSSGSS